MKSQNLQNQQILIVEDDTNMIDLLELVFSKEGADVYVASDGQEALHLFYTSHPDLIILDLMLPKISGLDICRQIRQFSNTPILMLTGLGQDEDVLRGLSSGADDYITKPFNPDILKARVEAVLRRSANKANKKATYSDEHLVIDLSKHRILVQDEPIKLTTKEYQLLAFLVKNAGQVMTFQQILEHVWGWEYQDSVDYVHVYVSRLRRKLEADPKQPKYLITEHGLGYRFTKMMGSDMQA